MTLPRALAASLCAAALLVASGCDLATANIDIPRTCITQRSVAMQGAPAGGTASARFNFDVGGSIPLLQSNPDQTNLEVDDIVIKPTGGNPDLTGITSARIQVGAENSTVASYTKSATTLTEISLSGSTVNVAPYVLGGQIDFRFETTGNPPAAQWTADVTACLHATSHASI